jgi:branched-subunit amino acid transport protein
MNPRKIKMSYVLGFIFVAVLAAAVLRHILHVDAGFSRKEILIGALIGAIVCVLLARTFFRQRRRR